MELDPFGLFQANQALLIALAERDRVIAEAHRVIEEQGKQIASLLVRVADLEEQVRKNSRNSSKPSSSDGPRVPKRAKKKPSGRKPGGQPGHTRHERPLVPPEMVTEKVVLKPTTCGGCGSQLSGDDPSPMLHQVVEIPEVKPNVRQFESHGLVCPCCGRLNREPLPPGVPRTGYGPRAEAFIALLSGVFRMSKRAIPELVRLAYGFRISTGSVVACQEQVSQALEVPFADALKHAREQVVKNADETGWRERRTKAYLWTVVTSVVTVFMIHARRASEAAEFLLGRIHGILVTDRYSGYDFWPFEFRQFCWAHLMRDFTAISERFGDGVLGRDLVAEARRLFVWWGRVRDGTLTQARFRIYMKSLQRRVEALLEKGCFSRNRKTRETCRRLSKRRQSLWTFVRHEGVEPTNNAAERSLRHAVIWRKISFGTHSAAGSRFVERILTVHATLSMQKRNVLEYLYAARLAALTQQAAPSLLPPVETHSELLLAA